MHSVRTAIGDYDKNWLQLTVTLIQQCQRLQRQRQAISQRCFAACRHFCQTLLRQIHAARNRQQQVCLVATEGNHAHAVALLIRLLQHIEDGSFDSTHTLACTHRAAGIYSEKEGVANTLFAYLLTQILLLDVERTAIVLAQALIRRCCTNRRVKGEVADLALRLLSTHITPLLQVGLRHTALAAATAHIAVLTKIQQQLRQAERFVNISKLLFRSKIAVVLFLLLPIPAVILVL